MADVRKCIIHFDAVFKVGDIVHIEEDVGFGTSNRDGRIINISDDEVTLDASEMYNAKTTTIPIKLIKVIYCM